MLESLSGSVAAAADQCILTAVGPAVRIQCSGVGDFSIYLVCMDGKIC